MTPAILPLAADGLAAAQRAVAAHHYLRRPVDQRCMPEGYAVEVDGRGVGYLIVGRHEATQCYQPSDSSIREVWRGARERYRACRRHAGTPVSRRRLRRELRRRARADIAALPGWYGSVEDVESGRAGCTRWQVLNLARVWLDPVVQPGGALHVPGAVPGFIDRRGVFRSTLASAAILQLLSRVGADYLERRPPCFLEEPYELQWLLSYCDTRLHRGTVYRAAGADLYRTNKAGIQTFRWPLPALAADADARVRHAAAVHPRSLRIRGRRAQLGFALCAAGAS